MILYADDAVVVCADKNLEKLKMDAENNQLQQTDPKLQKDQLCIIQFQTKRISNSI